MKTKSKIEKQLQNKTNQILVKTIVACKKNTNWLKLAEIFSGPRKNRINLNLEEISNKINDEKIIVVPGKILSQGELNKKIKLVAFDFSEKAKEKLKKAGIKTANLLEEIKKNPSATGIKILEK